VRNKSFLPDSTTSGDRQHRRAASWLVMSQQEAQDLLLLDVPAEHEVVDMEICVVGSMGDALASAQKHHELHHVSDRSFQVLQRDL
jgi:hypothetical protein